MAMWLLYVVVVREIKRKERHGGYPAVFQALQEMYDDLGG
jgi:hypothetical protein